MEAKVNQIKSCMKKVLGIILILMGVFSFIGSVTNPTSSSQAIKLFAFLIRIGVIYWGYKLIQSHNKWKKQHTEDEEQK